MKESVAGGKHRATLGNTINEQAHPQGVPDGEKRKIMIFRAIGFIGTDRSIRDCSEERYKSVKAAKDSCLFALEFEEKFALLLDNYFEFEKELLTLAEASRIWQSHEHGNSMLQRLTIDRRLVNLLTACRLYVDQTDHGISTLFGNPSGELSGIKSFKNHLYDDHWGYRFMEALRNHVQHSGLPVHIISYNSATIRGAKENYGQYTVVPKTKVRDLAENKSFKKVVLAELKSMGKEVDLRPAVREYIECFAELHECIRKTIEAKITDDRSIYESAIIDFSNIDGESARYVSLIQEREDGTTAEEVALVREFLDYLDSLRKRNRTDQKLKRSFAANSDQEPAR